MERDDLGGRHLERCTSEKQKEVEIGVGGMSMSLTVCGGGGGERGGQNGKALKKEKQSKEKVSCVDLFLKSSTLPVEKIQMSKC